LAFEEHVRRSIPAYAACHELILDLAEQVCRPGGRCYDLGCSTGTLTRQLHARLSPRDVEVIGVDRDPEMISQAIRLAGGLPTPQFLVAAVEEMEFERADLAVSFYTLQFVARRHRPSVLCRLHDALAPGGALVLFEKTVGESGQEQELNDGAYLDFKRRNGFSNSEIAEKRRSLRGILQPLTAGENHRLLRDAGFSEITHVFRWLMFDGVVAVSG
jgi:tRNA (cmo5U34)-methyltransferase